MIFYKRGYKYQLYEDFTININIYPDELVFDDYIQLNNEGELTIRKGYAWDGPSGPTWDTANFMRASLVHDALYQLMRLKIISGGNRKKADIELKQICIEDGMSKIRAWYVYHAVREFGKYTSRWKDRRKVYTAP